MVDPEKIEGSKTLKKLAKKDYGPDAEVSASKMNFPVPGSVAVDVKESKGGRIREQVYIGKTSEEDEDKVLGYGIQPFDPEEESGHVTEKLKEYFDEI